MTNYYDYQDFDKLLNTKSCPLFLLSNINIIPCYLENFPIYTGISNRHNVDLMAFCETRLSHDTEHLYKFNDYNLYTNNRNHYDGRVCLYVNTFVASFICDDLCMMNVNIETVFIEATYFSKQITIGVIYRRPNANIHSFLESLEKILKDIRLHQLVKS